MKIDQDSVAAGSVIQASGMVIFEDVLMTDVAAADTWLACSVHTKPVVHLAAHASSHLTQGGSPNLGKPSAEGYLSDRDGPNVQRQLRALSECNVGYCTVVRFQKILSGHQWISKTKMPAES